MKPLRLSQSGVGPRPECAGRLLHQRHPVLPDREREAAVGARGQPAIHNSNVIVRRMSRLEAARNFDEVIDTVELHGARRSIAQRPYAQDGSRIGADAQAARRGTLTAVFRDTDRKAWLFSGLPARLEDVQSRQEDHFVLAGLGVDGDDPHGIRRDRAAGRLPYR